MNCVSGGPVLQDVLSCLELGYFLSQCRYGGEMMAASVLRCGEVSRRAEALVLRMQGLPAAGGDPFDWPERKKCAGVGGRGGGGGVPAAARQGSGSSVL